MAIKYSEKFLNILNILRIECDIFRNIAEGFIFIQNLVTRYRAERNKANKLLKNQAFLLQPLINPLQQAIVLKNISKIIKLSDLELFYSIDYSLQEIWELNIYYKLFSNTNHFSTKALYISYIASRLNSISIECIFSRLESRALNLYKIAQDIFDYLSTIYSDLYCVIIAKAKFKALEQGTIPFYKFYTKFNSLANLYRYID